MKKNILIINIAASFLSIVSITLIPAGTFRGKSMTIYKTFDYFDKLGADIDFEKYCIIASLILVCINILLSLGNNHKMIIASSWLSALAFFASGCRPDEDAGAGIYLACLSFIIIAISSLKLKSSSSDQSDSTTSSKNKYNDKSSIEERRNYQAASALSEEELTTELKKAEGGELSNEYTESLMRVQQERKEQTSTEQKRTKLYLKAAALTQDEIDDELLNHKRLEENYVAALRYIKRSMECSIPHSEENFFETFRRGYKAPETPAEKEKRKRLKKKALEQQMLEQNRAATRRKVILCVIVVILLTIVAFTMVLSANSKYNELKDEADLYFKRALNSSTMNKTIETNALYRYKDCLKNLPYFDKDLHTAQITKQINLLKERIAIIDEQINKYNERVKSGEYLVGDVYKNGSKTGIVFKVNGKHGSIILARVINTTTYEEAEKQGRIPTESEARAILANKDMLIQSFDNLPNSGSLFNNAFWIDKKTTSLGGKRDYYIRTKDMSIGHFMRFNINGKGRTSAIFIENY